MDLDKIIKGLEVCCDSTRNCGGCPYESDSDDCSLNMKMDAAAVLRELRLQATMQKCAEAGKEITESIAEEAAAMSEEIDAQAQAIETLHLINARLEGKVEAYEGMLRHLVKE